MLVRNTFLKNEAFINSSMSLYNVVLYGYEKTVLLSAILQENLAGITLCMIVEGAGQEKVLTEDDRLPDGHVILLR